MHRARLAIICPIIDLTHTKDTQKLTKPDSPPNGIFHARILRRQTKFTLFAKTRNLNNPEELNVMKDKDYIS